MKVTATISHHHQVNGRMAGYRAEYETNGDSRRTEVRLMWVSTAWVLLSHSAAYVDQSSMFGLICPVECLWVTSVLPDALAPMPTERGRRNVQLESA